MTRTCPKCNQINPADAAFCLNCASPISAPPPYVGAPPPVGAQPVDLGGSHFGTQPQAGASQRAIIALSLALAGLFCCGPFTALPAAVVGWIELDAINKGQSPPAGKWMAQVGLWGGIVFTILHVIGYFVWIGLSMLASNPYAY